MRIDDLSIRSPRFSFEMLLQVRQSLLASERTGQIEPMAGSGWRGHGLTSREAGNVAAKPDFPFQQVPELDIERSPVVYVLVDTIVEDKMVSADVTHNFPGLLVAS
jgi:hypothetical protein